MSTAPSTGNDSWHSVLATATATAIGLAAIINAPAGAYVIIVIGRRDPVALGGHG